MYSTTFILTLLSFPTLILSHGLMTTPNQRGTLQVWDFNPHSKEIDPEAPIDFWAHFPAGDKSSKPGAGKNSQLRAAQPQGWTPFKPLQPSFKWRASVCGDPLSGPFDHLKGGKYYHDAQIVAEYKQGSTLKVELNIVAHHNGFIELHVCDVKRCGGEISAQCFKQGHCYQLKRARNAKCDSGMNKNCAPIDERYPERWYLPCSPTFPKKAMDFYGADDTILYKLPDHLSCEHCVLHWFWTAANNCNPPGVKEFFEGENAPKWPPCPGEGGAVGGYSKVQAECGGDRLPEEYYQCADIRINPREDRSEPSPSESSEPSEPSMNPTKTPTPSKSATASVMPSASPTPSGSMYGNETEVPESSEESFGEATQEVEGSADGMSNIRDGVIRDVVLVADGNSVMSLYDGDNVDVSAYEQLSIECVTSKKVDKVQFYIDGKLTWTERNARYFLFGNTGDKPKYWKNPILNRQFVLETRAGGEVDTVHLTFSK